MRKRGLWLLGGAFVAVLAAALVAGPVMASQPVNPNLGLASLTSPWVEGGQIQFQVTVPQDDVGGWANLFATVHHSDGTMTTQQVAAFGLAASNFVVTAPVVGQAGESVDYQYQAFNAQGVMIGWSTDIGGEIDPGSGMWAR